MKKQFKKLYAIVIIFIITLVTATTYSSLEQPKENNLQIFLHLPYEIIEKIFFPNDLQCHLNTRLLRKEKNDNNNQNLEIGDEEEITIQWIQQYSAEKLEQFLIQRIKTCISNSCFFNNRLLEELEKDGAPKSLLRPAWKKAVQDPLIAAFVCQSIFNKNIDIEYGTWMLYIWKKKFKTHHEQIKLSVNNTNHICKQLNTDRLSTIHTLDNRVQSLIFHPHNHAILPITQEFFSKIYNFITHNTEAMKNIVLITLYGKTNNNKYPFVKQMDILKQINNFLKQYPNIKISIQDQELDTFIKEHQLIDENKLINHNRKSMLNYSEKHIFGYMKCIPSSSPLFFYDWIRICQNRDISTSNKEITLYIQHKKHNGCERKLGELITFSLLLNDIDLTVLKYIDVIHTPEYLINITKKLYNKYMKYKEKLLPIFSKHPSVYNKLLPYLHEEIIKDFQEHEIQSTQKIEQRHIEQTFNNLHFVK